MKISSDLVVVTEVELIPRDILGHLTIDGEVVSYPI